MKINKLQINDFGKFSNKEIIFNDNINIVKGDNEAGKSTIQKFIVSMIYGISKDKRKSSFTDYDKYFPWDRESFSGKIIYTLDNNQKYEVFRDFTKKMPTIYNENAEDITSKYGSSKTKGSNFFEEQTGVDEKMMLSSMITEQGETVIDQSSENFIIQKIANITQTGDEKVSYENAQSFLVKKRNEDVGTEKTKNRPVNVLKDEKKELLSEKVELEEYSIEQYEIEEQIYQMKKQIEENEKLLNFVNDYKKISDEESESNNKIDIYQESLNNNNIEKNEIKKEIEIIKEEITKAKKEYNSEFVKEESEEKQKNDKIKELNETKEKKHKKYILFSIVFAIIAIISLITMLIPITIVAVIGIVISIVMHVKSKKKIEKDIENLLSKDKSTKSIELYEEVEKIENRLKEKEMKVELIDKNNYEIQQQINEQKNIIKNNKQEKIEKLLEKYEGASSNYKEIINDKFNISKAQTIQRTCNENKLELQKYQYKKDIIMKKIEKLAEVQEKLYDIDEKLDDLQKQAEAIGLTMKVLEESYEEMKENIVPKFTENLSKTIFNISGGRYSKVVTNDKEGLMIEKQNGEYIPAKALSIGTIDQLYLSLRLAIAEEATNETIPIILDEAFAYYDSERLSNILNYISKELKNNQIIIFTCTSRELSKMNNLGIKYNLIEIK